LLRHMPLYCRCFGDALTRVSTFPPFSAIATGRMKKVETEPALVLRRWLSHTRFRATTDVVGVTAPGSSTHMLINYLLVKHGLTPGDISAIGIGGGAGAAAAVEHGKVDAAIVTDPVLTQVAIEVGVFQGVVTGGRSSGVAIPVEKAALEKSGAIESLERQHKRVAR